MGATTGIQWTDATWNPIAGCALVSPGCTHCYAMREAHRLARMGVAKYDGLTTLVKDIPVWTGTVRLHEPHLAEPLHWKKPRRIFVNSMSDLFHEDLPDAAIDKVFAVMALCPQHTFQVLTKRAARMRDYMIEQLREERIDKIMDEIAPAHWCAREIEEWPLPNVWLGVSVEDQARADERIPLLLDTPAAVRFLSCEPLLGPVRLMWAWIDGEGRVSGVDKEWCRAQPSIGWVIAGGESGTGARPMHPDWARALRDQCAAAGVPFFFKQWGEWISRNESAPNMRPRDVDRLFLWDEADIEDGNAMLDVGKKRAGRLLDGREHSEFPR